MQSKRSLNVLYFFSANPPYRYSPKLNGNVQEPTPFLAAEDRRVRAHLAGDPQFQLAKHTCRIPLATEEAKTRLTARNGKHTRRVVALLAEGVS